MLSEICTEKKLCLVKISLSLVPINQNITNFLKFTSSTLTVIAQRWPTSPCLQFLIHLKQKWEQICQLNKSLWDSSKWKNNRPGQKNVTIVNILLRAQKFIVIDLKHSRFLASTAKPLNSNDVEPNHYIQQLPKAYTRKAPFSLISEGR